MTLIFVRLDFSVCNKEGKSNICSVRRLKGLKEAMNLNDQLLVHAQSMMVIAIDGV